MVKYLKGDATQPVGNGPKIIVHVCNDIGGWGAGFVLALNRMSSKPQQAYRTTFKNRITPFLPLGTIEVVSLGDGLYVCNMVAQHGTVSKLNPKPISYIALEACLINLAQWIDDYEFEATVHMPRIGCGLAGGDWTVVESIIDRTLTLQDIDVTVYDL
jgi:O-acetyl-ADP-ribose deacetylase (regulator of RNase III)